VGELACVAAAESTEDKSVSTDPVEDDAPMFEASTSRGGVDEVGGVLETRGRGTTRGGRHRMGCREGGGEAEDRTGIQ
jgi:hypothetical protein